MKEVINYILYKYIAVFLDRQENQVNKKWWQAKLSPPAGTGRWVSSAVQSKRTALPIIAGEKQKVIKPSEGTAGTLGPQVLG